MTSGLRTMRRLHLRLNVVLLMLAAPVPDALAQFSPGELSKSHSDLEGVTNCTRCHEMGAEISGVKCLDCHGEIKRAVSSGHGFHAGVASQRCVQCHKEHLGQNAETVVISRKDFDHTRTGFTLTGKHRGLRCEDCHRTEFVKENEVLKLMTEKGRASVLGLNTQCSSCHQDRHRQTLGTDCQSCHSTEGWKPAVSFDHGKTAFRLLGKHAGLECAKCHEQPAGTERIFELRPERFEDCTPCHSSPHRQKLAELCSSCHTPTAWKTVVSASFNHDMTGFPLKGRHAIVRCEQCHGTSGTTKRTATGKNRVCADCHTDVHHGEFSTKYKNDCSTCHSVSSFSPSTFTMEMHTGTRFPLTGAHLATVCNDCHRRSGKELRFRFATLACSTCHTDPHAGQFASTSGVPGCSDCHNTSTWKLPDFDHAKTGFALAGKHLSTRCEQCHREAVISGVKAIRYVNTPAECESCHEEPHAGQFRGGTNSTCVSCHTPSGWAALAFDHNKQSTFSLTGGHANVSCRRCHGQETIGGKVVVRYRPLEKECKHCHSGSVPDGR